LISWYNILCEAHIDVKRVCIYENQQQNTQPRFTNMKRSLVGKS